MITIQAAGMSDVGRLRKNNEDNFAVEGSLLVVADGMGGAAAGEIASSIAVDILKKNLATVPNASDDEIAALVKKAIDDADAAIKKRTARNPETNGMGTTVVLALQIDDRILLANVGDSRAYLISTRPKTPSGINAAIDANAQTAILQPISLDVIGKNMGSIKRVTEDHSIVMELVRNGVIAEEDIRTHPLRNRITRCLGSLREDSADITWIDPNENDVLILCSDGLWEMVHEDIILAVAHSSDSMEETCKRLIDAANDAGGADNITVIAARFQKN